MSRMAGSSRLPLSSYAISIPLADMIGIDTPLYSLSSCPLQTSSHSFRTAALLVRSAGVPSKTMRPWPIT